MVIEFGMRHGVSTVALLSGQPKRMVSYDLNHDPVAEIRKSKQGATDFSFVQGDSLSIHIDRCDPLFIDTRHTADQLTNEFQRHAASVRRWIALHDSQIFGEHLEDGGPGLLPAKFDAQHQAKVLISHRPLSISQLLRKSHNVSMEKQSEDRK